MHDTGDLNSPTGKLVTVVVIAAVIGIAVISGGPAPKPSPALAPGATPRTARTKDIVAIKAEEALKRAREAQVKGDLQDAFTWMRIAAVLGNAVAQAGLGAMYQGGQGVPRDYAEAIRWYRLAVAQGNGSAHNNLAFMYAMGLGVEPGSP